MNGAMMIDDKATAALRNSRSKGRTGARVNAAAGRIAA